MQILFLQRAKNIRLGLHEVLGIWCLFPKFHNECASLGMFEVILSNIVFDSTHSENIEPDTVFVCNLF